MGIKSKRILITGASRGLGAAAALYFAEQGARLAIISRSFDDLEKVRRSCRASKEHTSISIDLLDLPAIESAVSRAQEFLGGIDVVLHAAGGGLGMRDPFLSHENFLTLFKLNIGAAAEINRLVSNEMKGRKAGNLVHVGSIASSEGVGSVGYNAVKAALAGYVRTIGRELANFDVVATGILPGGFISHGNAMDRLRTNYPEAYDKFVNERLPRHRMGEVKELLPLLSLLCSEDASMMSGCLVPIDAGEGLAYGYL